MDLSKLSTPTSVESIVGTPPKYSYKAGTYTIFNRETGQIETVDINKIGGDLRANIDNIIKRGTPWPQASIDKGFLSPYFIGPSKDFRYGTTPKSTDQYTTSGNVDNQPSSPESNLYSSPNIRISILLFWSIVISSNSVEYGIISSTYFTADN